jgi:hypothetical protein
MLYPFSRFPFSACAPANCGAAESRERGFNLIEAAIVLGVVGLVIGGIWVAASAVKDRLDFSELQKGVLQIVEGGRRNLPLSIWNENPSAFGLDMTSTIIAMGIPPSDWVKSSTVIQAPSGAGIVFYYVSAQLNIQITNLDRADCSRIISYMNNMPSDIGLLLTSTLPIGGWGCADSGNVVSFRFSPTQLN